MSPVAWRGGGRQANLSRLLAMCAEEPMTEARRRDAVVTADPRHLERVAQVARVRLRIESV